MSTSAGSPSLLLLHLLLLASVRLAALPDLASEKAALQTLRAAVGRSVLAWNESLPPCAWQGVVCDSGRVRELRLPGAGLVGSVPAGVFGNLTALRTLSLRFNALSGSLPSDLAALSQLRNLYLQDNSLSGEIPSPIFALRNLVRLNLGGNSFSGAISADFDNLERLRTLNLDRNRLAGEIPALNLTLDQFNVSYNLLNGSIPPNFRSMPPTSFLGLNVCGLASNPCPGDGAPIPSPASGGEDGDGKKKGISGVAVAGIGVGSAVGLVLLVIVLCLFCPKKTGSKTSSLGAGGSEPPESEMPARDKGVEGGSGGTSAANSMSAAGIAAKGGGGDKKLVFFGSGPRVFDLEELLGASAEVLGKGTFGTAYKAMLGVGTTVAVKRLRDVLLPETEFRDKMEAIGAMGHPNLVPLLAYYCSKEEKLLVYEYMPMGSLSALLHGSRGSGRPPLRWETRVGLALSAARGVEYIHSRGPGVSHGNIRSSNVLLDEPDSARVSDHGLADLAGDAALPGRGGYRAPEVTDARKVSQKADVYSFGVLLLELLTGKDPSPSPAAATAAALDQEGVDLPRWVQSVVREEWTAEVFDAELLRYQNAEEEMMQLLQLAIDCTAQYPEKRPSVAEVVTRIEEIRRSGAEAYEHERRRRCSASDDADDGQSSSKF